MFCSPLSLCFIIKQEKKPFARNPIAIAYGAIIYASRQERGRAEPVSNECTQNDRDWARGLGW